MPKAPDIQFLDDAAHVAARKYIVEQFPGVVGVKLKQDDGSPWLVNPSNNTTYNVAVGMPQQDPRILTVAFLAGALPRFGRVGSVWYGLLNPATSQLHLITTADLTALMNNWQATAGGVTVTQNGEYLMFHLNVAYLQDTNKIRKTFTLGKGDDSFDMFRRLDGATDDGFCHLHAHSMYSLLDGATSIEGMARAAALNGQKAMALTDHGVMFGTWKFYKACREWGVKPLLGVEAYVVDDLHDGYRTADGTKARFEHHMGMVAMNDEGWGNLCQMMSEASRDWFHYVPRIGHELIRKYNKGIIFFTGCFKGLAPWYCQDFDPPPADMPAGQHKWWFKKDLDRAFRYLQFYKEMLGDRLYGEVMNIDFERYMRCVPTLREMYAKLGIKEFMSNDCHYETAEESIVQALASRINNTKVDELGDKFTKQGCYFIKSVAEMKADWTSPNLFSTTMEVAERCNIDWSPKKGESKYLFPRFPVEDDVDWQEFLQSEGARQ
jgi:hypothetical protein